MTVSELKQILDTADSNGLVDCRLLSKRTWEPAKEQVSLFRVKVSNDGFKVVIEVVKK